MTKHEKILFLGTSEDAAFYPRMKPYTNGIKIVGTTTKVDTIYAVESLCRSKGATAVFTTQAALVAKLAGRDKVSIDDYAGSYFERNGIEYVVLDPLSHTVTVPYGTFLLKRFMSKLISPEQWLEVPEFSFEVLDRADKFDNAIQFLSSCDVIGVDIETLKEPLAFYSISFTGLRWNGSGLPSCTSYVISIKDIADIFYVRKILDLPAAKVFQNGKYDLAYLARFNCPVRNYLWDTATMMHAWYSELPKNLGFLQAFFVRKAAYWKDLGDSPDLYERLKYNAKDTWATVFAALAWLGEAPDWAFKNYRLEFPMLFPCHLSEMTGLKASVEKMNTNRAAVLAKADEKAASLDKMLGVTGFNVNSPIHMRKLLDTLGLRALPKADDKHLAKAAFKHPLNARIINTIRGVPKSSNPDEMGIRALRKVASTYLVPEKLFHDRILYALNPHGTDSGRLASKEHHFWCGMQIQNFPSGSLVKSAVMAEDGFFIGECDLEQAETRDTAYITGDAALISAVSSDRDFHSLNTAAFFGVPYEQIYDDGKKKTLNKALRDLAKRVNHGANYNMGAYVLVDTMGEEKIYQAAKLLGLPKSWDALQIAEELLERFARTYPVVRYDYQKWVVSTIKVTRMLVGATGWTRYCFSDPATSKPALNSYISHSPQSLNAMVLNQAFKKVFYDIAIHPEHRRNFRLYAQIHDSIFFGYRDKHEYLADMVKERMEIPVTIKDIKGVERTFTVPAALKLGKTDDAGNLIRATNWATTE